METALHIKHYHPTILSTTHTLPMFEGRRSYLTMMIYTSQKSSLLNLLMQ
jgi:hypothetical protein